MKRLILIIAVAMMIGLYYGHQGILPVNHFSLDIPSSHAESPTPPDSCKGELSIFLSSLLSFEDSNQYWTDIFKRNRCQQDDIFEIDSKIDTLLDEMREEFFNGCSSPEIAEIQQEIRELKMELYYVRNIVEIEEDTNFKRDVEETEEADDGQEEKVKFKMLKRFVQEKKWLTEEVFEEKFASFVDEYESRIETYLECPSSPWQEVATKWKEFQEGVSELMKISKGDKDDEKESETEKPKVEAIGEKNSGGSAVPGFFEKFFTLRLNEVESKRGLPELMQDAKEQGDMLNVDEAFKATQKETLRLNREVHKAELLARYDLLYYRGSADITNDLGTRLEGLMDLVSSTTNGPLKALFSASKQLHEKQGKTSPN